MLPQLSIGKPQNLIVDISQNRVKNGIEISHLLKYKRGKMAKLKLTLDQKLNLGAARRILGAFEMMLEEENMEFVLESENMFIRTIDQQTVFKLVDLGIEDSSGRDGVILLPRTTDAQELVPIILNGKDV